MTRRYDVNLSILFTELPVLQRPAAAASAGFDAIEFWWPFPSPCPSDSDVDGFARAIEDAGVQLVGLNFFAGDMPGGDRGLVSWPARIGGVPRQHRRHGRARSTAWLSSLQRAVRQPRRRRRRARAGRPRSREPCARRQGGCRSRRGRPGRTGQRRPALPAAQGRRRDRPSSTVCSVSPAPTTCACCSTSITCPSMATTSTPRSTCTRTASGTCRSPTIPGRNEPGTGELPTSTPYLSRLEAAGYDGYVGLEYKPSGASVDRLPTALS